MRVDPTAYYDGLDPETREVLDFYKSDDPYRGAGIFSADLNSWLREGRALDADWDEKIRLLDQAISGNQTISEGLLFRATCWAHLQTFVQGTTLQYPAYMSTSERPSTPARILRRELSDRVLLKISTPAGMEMLAMEGNPVGGGDEDEFLIGRGTSFLITSDENVTDMARIAAELFPAAANTITQLRVIALTAQ